jgi:hypothetical protein
MRAASPVVVANLPLDREREQLAAEVRIGVLQRFEGAHDELVLAGGHATTRLQAASGSGSSDGRAGARERRRVVVLRDECVRADVRRCGLVQTSERLGVGSSIGTCFSRARKAAALLSAISSAEGTSRSRASLASATNRTSAK